MSLPTLTRIKAADLIEITGQANVPSNALLSNILISLQSNVSTVPAPLNTLCPTCSVNGSPQGFVSVPLPYGLGNVNAVCYTCKGYMKYYTVSGQLTPPQNPYNAPLVATRIRPADITEAHNAFPSATRLDAMITALQGNFDPTLDFSCPQCIVNNVSTGFIVIKGHKVLCPCCAGNGKTAVHMVMVNGIAQQYYPPEQADPPPQEP